MRKATALICCAATATMGLAGCSGHAAARPAAAPARSTAAPAPSTAAPARSIAAVRSSPGCSTSRAAAPALGQVRTAMTEMTGPPFGVAVTADGKWAFVAEPGADQIKILRTGSALSPAAVRSVTLPAAAFPAGETVTRDGRYLLAAVGDGAAVISVQRAEQGVPGAVLGILRDPRASGATEVAVSPDGSFAFVAEEDSAVAAVFNLRFALAHDFSAGSYVGSIPLGLAPVGLAVSPDGRWLYATSEDIPGHGETGTLSVISLPRAETDPAASVVATVQAGCNPVRVIMSADGSEVWVTARASDALLGFSASLLRTDPARALTAVVRVGEAPVGLMLVGGGTRIVVADSDRFTTAGATADLAVVNVPLALAGKPALLGYIPAGQFPREMALEPGGRTLLVTNYSSSQLEAVDVATLP